MSNSWQEIDEVRARVANLIKESGALLEARVSGICRQYAGGFPDYLDQNDGDIVVKTQRLIYSEFGDENDAPREVDQCVSFYGEFEVSEQIGLQLILMAPIECKNRNGIKIFGIKGVEPNRPLAAPVVSNFSRTELLLPIRNYTPDVLTATVSNIVLVEFRNETTPHSVFKEQIIEKAAASLYDFVRFDFTTRSGRAGTYEESLCEEAGFNERFQLYKARQPNYPIEFLITKFIEGLTKDEFASFNAKYHGGERLYHGLSVALPIICMDSPIYLMEVDDSEQTTYKDVPWLVAPVRIRKWRSSLYQNLVPFTAEVPVIVTNPEGLPEVLKQAHQLFEDVRHLILERPEEVKDSALLEWALKDLLSGQRDQSFRSDLEIDWF